MAIIIDIIKELFGGKGSTNTNTNNISINNNVGASEDKIKNTNLSSSDMENTTGTAKVGFLKDSARILFIDDLDLESKIINLISAGWKNVIQINEASNIDRTEIREADIIFVDYKGIVKDSEEQGLAVLSALKGRYGNSKWLILYSAHEVPINAFNKGANSYLAKNSSVYELEQKIIEGLVKLNK